MYSKYTKNSCNAAIRNEKLNLKNWQNIWKDIIEEDRQMENKHRKICSISSVSYAAQWSSKYAHILIFTTCAYVTFHGKGTAHMLKVKDLEKGDYTELFWWIQSCESLKLAKCPQKEMPDRRRIPRMLCCWVWQGRKGPWAKECEHLLEVGSQGNRFTPRISRKECNPIDNLIVAQWDQCWISNQFY